MKFLLGLGFILIAGVHQQSLADDDPQIWLERMGAAMSQMSYQGTFIYISDDRMETMRITHVIDEHGARERLASVSGPRREVVRDQSGLKWISGDGEAIMADPLVNWPMFLDQSVRGLSAKSGYYHLNLREQKRIAERMAQRLDIVAVDEFRYGYSLWLESGSGLLLQWQLNNPQGEALAKLVFTELKMGSEVDESELQNRNGKVRKTKSGLPPAITRSVASAPQWQAHWLPPGFRMTADRAPKQATDKPFQHQVYSDGIASVSLYVEPLDSSAGAGTGLQELGTSHLFSLKNQDAVVTVVGDVPAITVEKIAYSVSRNQP